MRTIGQILDLSAVHVGASDELLDLVFELALERPNLLEDDAESDQGIDGGES